MYQAGPEEDVYKRQPLSFEPVEPGRCSPVLYSASIPDMIDYSLRSCVERGITAVSYTHLPLRPADSRWQR